MRRRGPVSLSQLEILARWEMIDQNELLSDESGKRRTTVHEFLAAGGWPSAPVSLKGPSPPLRPTRFGRVLPERKPEKLPAVKEPLRDPTLTNDQFMALIDHAVHMERNARTVELERTESQIEVFIPGPGAIFVRTSQFDWSYNLIAFVFIVNALICCLFSTSTMGMFAKRFLKLSASVFIPFEQTTLIEGEPLMQCGMALVLILGQFILPIWWLVRQDCVIWHGLGATFFGLLLGAAMKPEWLWFGFEGIRATAALSGLAICGIAWHLSCCQHAERVAARIRIAAVITALLSAGITLVDMKSIFIVDLTELSPTVNGSGPHLAVFAICFFGVMVMIPFAVVSILYDESAEVVRTYMFHTAITVIMVGVVGGGAAMCIAYPQSANFINVAMALLPLACANILAIITPPVLWILAPHSSLPRE